MNKLGYVIIITAIAAAGFFAFNSYIYNQKQGNSSQTSTTSNSSPTSNASDIIVTPISHASLILSWDNTIIYSDPTGGAEAYVGKPNPNIVVVTDIHGDHLNTDTLNAVMKEDTTLIVPQAVKDMLPENLAGRASVLANESTTTVLDFNITGVPMYNLPESPDNRHVKGRGNGYVIEKAGKRVYIAGDTAGIPEMRALTNIDMAFIPMNQPFTMGVEEAASAVLDFKPKQVYPFHYRGQEGMADTNKFKELVNASNPDIEVILLNWYPTQ